MWTAGASYPETEKAQVWKPHQRKTLGRTLKQKPANSPGWKGGRVTHEEFFITSRNRSTDGAGAGRRLSGRCIGNRLVFRTKVPPSIVVLLIRHTSRLKQKSDAFKCKAAFTLPRRWVNVKRRLVSGFVAGGLRSYLAFPPLEPTNLRSFLVFRFYVSLIAHSEIAWHRGNLIRKPTRRKSYSCRQAYWGLFVERLLVRRESPIVGTIICRVIVSRALWTQKKNSDSECEKGARKNNRK